MVLQDTWDMKIAFITDQYEVIFFVIWNDVTYFNCVSVININDLT